jgi:hypothetical protein
MMDQNQTTKLTAEVAANTKAIYESGLERLIQEREMLTLLRSRAEAEQQSTRYFDQLLAEKDYQIRQREQRIGELEARAPKTGSRGAPRAKSGKMPEEPSTNPDDMPDASGLTPRQRRAIFDRASE